MKKFVVPVALLLTLSTIFVVQNKFLSQAEEKRSRERDKPKTIEDLIQESTLTAEESTESTMVYDKPGGIQTALDDFYSMNPKDIKDFPTAHGIGKIGILADGSRIIYRPGAITSNKYV